MSGSFHSRVRTRPQHPFIEVGMLHSDIFAQVDGPTQRFLKHVFVAESVGGLLKGDSSLAGMLSG